MQQNQSQPMWSDDFWQRHPELEKVTLTEPQLKAVKAAVHDILQELHQKLTNLFNAE